MHRVKSGRIQCLIHQQDFRNFCIDIEEKERIRTYSWEHRSANQQRLLKTFRENRVASEMQNNQYLLLVTDLHFPLFTLLIVHLSFHAIKSRGL